MDRFAPPPVSVNEAQFPLTGPYPSGCLDEDVDGRRIAEKETVPFRPWVIAVIGMAIQLPVGDCPCGKPLRLLVRRPVPSRLLDKRFSHEVKNDRLAIMGASLRDPLGCRDEQAFGSCDRSPRLIAQRSDNLCKIYVFRTEVIRELQDGQRLFHPKGIDLEEGIRRRHRVLLSDSTRPGERVTEAGNGRGSGTERAFPSKARPPCHRSADCNTICPSRLQQVLPCCRRPSGKERGCIQRSSPPRGEAKGAERPAGSIHVPKEKRGVAVNDLERKKPPEEEGPSASPRGAV